MLPTGDPGENLDRRGGDNIFRTSDKNWSNDKEEMLLAFVESCWLLLGHCKPLTAVCEIRLRLREHFALGVRYWDRDQANFGEMSDNEKAQRHRRGD